MNPKYKVGDRVKVDVEYRLTHGCVGTVERIVFDVDKRPRMSY